MEEITELTVDKSIWLRGEGSSSSALLRESDGKMCCLGVYLHACGVTKELLKSQLRPSDVNTEIPAWLLTKPGGKYNRTSPLARALIQANDDHFYTQAQRERKIKKLFAQAGVKVIFKGE